MTRAAWEGRVRVGDARRALPTLPSRTFDLIFTSPPYWTGEPRELPGEIGVERSDRLYVVALRTVGAEVRRLLKPGGWLVLVLGDPGGRRIPWRVSRAIERLGLVPGSPSFWLRPGPSALRMEAVLFFSRGRGRCREGCDVPHGGLWPVAPPRPREGYDVLPEEMVEAVIEGHSPPGGAVLDPFLGWGTVAEVAKRLGRRWCGVELDPRIAERTQKRLRREESDQRSPRYRA